NCGEGGGVYSKLLSPGPPLQIEGKYGDTAAIAEMLVQRHERFISRLQALPQQREESGYYKALKAQGGFTVDVKWIDAAVTDFKIYSRVKTKVKVKVNGQIKSILTTALKNKN